MNPQEVVVIPPALTPRQWRVVNFALQRFANDAHARANAAGQDRTGRYFREGAFEAFQQDAFDADDALGALRAAHQVLDGPRPNSVQVLEVPGDTIPTLSVGSPGDAEYDSWEPLPSRTQYVAHLEKALAGWQEATHMARRDVAQLQAQLLLHSAHQARDVWFWQGDGSDHPESMSNSMVVVIRAPQLRRILAGTEALMAIRGRVDPRDGFNGDTPHLINCMRALVNLDKAGAVTPSIGGHASTLLLAAASRLEQAEAARTGAPNV